MENPIPGDRATVKRLAKRASYDRDTIHRILDEGLICHVGFSTAGQPFVIPTIYVRIGDSVYLHGSPASRLLRIVQSGAPVCINVTLIDGLVLARSAFHHSMNYRSVVLFGKGSVVAEPEQKNSVLFALSEHLLAGRWADVRAPTPNELRQTLVVRIPIEEASAKIRTGPPIDDEADYSLPIWAGVLPLGLVAGKPVAEARLQSGIAPPEYTTRFTGAQAAPFDAYHCELR